MRGYPGNYFLIGVNLIIISLLMDINVEEVNAFFMGIGFMRMRRPVRVVVIRRGNGGTVNYPPGYKEAILTIAAFCIKQDKCVSDATQGNLYKCFNGTDGKQAAFVNKFEGCVTAKTEGCNKQSINALTTCVGKMGQNKANGVKVPKANSECMRSVLTVKNLECLRSRYKSLDKLFPLNAKPNNG
ncbi:unnamed protein product, partial [Medioppia subpectinata]